MGDGRAAANRGVVAHARACVRTGRMPRAVAKRRLAYSLYRISYRSSLATRASFARATAAFTAACAHLISALRATGRAALAAFWITRMPLYIILAAYSRARFARVIE